MVKIATWNVNSIKSRLQHLTNYLKNSDVDILLLQELKCQTDAFPYMEIEDLGFNTAVIGQKTYNGVAIISKYPIDDIITKLPGDENDEQARYVEGVVSLDGNAIRVASVYVPNGSSPDSDKFQYKMKFFDRLHSHIQKLLQYEELMVIGGDYNVAPFAIDVYDPKSLEGTICYHKDEREKFRKILNSGVTDAYRAMNDNMQQFSWWDYRSGGWQQNKGMRIDHLLLSPEAVDKLEAANIDLEPRGLEKPSDHTPVFCSLNMNK